MSRAVLPIIKSARISISLSITFAVPLLFLFLFLFSFSLSRPFYQTPVLALPVPLPHQGLRGPRSAPLPSPPPCLMPMH